MIFSEKVYFISEHSNQELLHGGVGPVDIENILSRNNAFAIRFPYRFDFSFKAKFARFLYLLKMGLTIEPGAILVFQHPLYALMSKLLLRIIKLRRSVLVICLVADIDGLKDGNDDLLQKEKLFFLKYTHFVLHNPNMEAWLRAFHPAAFTAVLTCFDYLTHNQNYTRSKSNTIVFAGNLNKSRFLENLDVWLGRNPSLLVNLYGPFITDAMLVSKKVSYKGLHHPYSLPDIIEGSFGLIWDGEGLEQPSGSLGFYMHFISHHKLSLYIISNLPVIVHEKAGSAEFVKKFNIGFTVKSLFEIEVIIATLPETAYQEMVLNTYDLANEIKAGVNILKAIEELVTNKRKSSRFLTF